MSAFLGMRGTGDWQTDERPKNWRETILYLYPNGTAALTAILSKMGSEKVDDPQFHWWTKMLQEQGGTVAGTFSDVGLSTTYDDHSKNKGDIVYAKCAESVAGHFRVGHQALLRLTNKYSIDTVGKVVESVQSGANSYVAVRLLEDDKGSAGDDAHDYIMAIGTINAEGAVMPDPIAYDPVKWWNYTQIFRTPLSITRTAQRTRLRTTEAYQEAKREALEYHSIEMERAILFGVPTEEIGANGKPERTTMGLINAIRGGYTGHGGRAGHVFDAPTDLSSNDTWIDEGEEWLDEKLEEIFRYGSDEKMALCGTGALLGINRLVKAKGTFEYQPTTAAYGIQVVKWTTPFGVINLKTHPLFSYEETMRHSMVLFEPNNIKFRFIDDTTFYEEGEQQNTGYGRKDSRDEEYLTEAGLEYHHPVSWGLLTGVGKDGE